VDEAADFDAVRRADDTARHYGDEPDEAARKAAIRAGVDPETVDEARRTAYRSEVSFAEALERVKGRDRHHRRACKVW
jgi:hypothetical protein